VARVESTGVQPRIGLILGSGLGAFSERLFGAQTLPYAEIPHFPKSSVEGHQGALVLGACDGVALAVMSGRVHAYEGYTPAEVVFPVRVLAELGVTTLVLTNAAGGVNPTLEPGDFMLITDHLNLTGRNPLVGPNDERS
jgi:purine-nucleoside phosphorylase